MKNNPLVSICVITYNSVKYVLETLESAKNQTYQNIELIISDDCSTDSTVDICKKWLENNKNRFVRTEILIVDKNTGIAKNCNRALNNSTGEYIKFIAGDDILLYSCVEDYVNYVKKNPNVNVIFSKMIYFRNEYKSENIFPASKTLKIYKNFWDKSANEQLNVVAKICRIPAPTLFINKDLFLKIGGYDERFFIEDWPTWIRCLEKGNKFYFMNIETVAYRNHYGSASNKDDKIFSFKMVCARYMIFKYKTRKYLSVEDKCINYLIYYWSSCFEKLGFNRDNVICRGLYKILEHACFKFLIN